MEPASRKLIKECLYEQFSNFHDTSGLYDIARSFPESDIIQPTDELLLDILRELAAEGVVQPAGRSGWEATDEYIKASEEGFRWKRIGI